MDTITLTQDLKDRVLKAISAEPGEYEPADRDSVTALLIGTEIPRTLPYGREERLAWYPDEATPEEIVSIAISAFQIPVD